MHRWHGPERTTRHRPSAAVDPPRGASAAPAPRRKIDIHTKIGHGYLLHERCWGPGRPHAMRTTTRHWRPFRMSRSLEILRER